jgi:ParB family chromosome partitioning protein
VSRPTGRNVRKTPRMSIPELAASIQRVGLLQNLIVIAAADGEHYEVVAGGRRLAALKLLAKKHRISKEWEVPCLLVADGTARTASLTENVQREAMHPPTSSRHSPRWWPKADPSRTLPRISASRRWWCSAA